MTENDISHILRDAIPEDPGTAGWGERVRRTHRRRQVAGGVAVAVGLVAIGVPIALQTGLTTTPVVLATPSPSTTNPVDGALNLPLQSDACHDSVGIVTELPDGILPAGATRMWLCDGQQAADVPRFGPAEPLTKGVDRAVAAFNALKAVDEDATASDDCVFDESFEQVFTLVVDYSDGNRKILSGTTHGCADMGDGENLWAGGDQFFDELVSLWRGQRQSESYTVTSIDVPCPASESFMTASVGDAVGGTLCGYDSSSDHPREAVMAVQLPDDLVARMTAEMQTQSVPAPAHDAAVPLRTLVLQNAFADPITVSLQTNGSWAWDEGGNPVSWTPRTGLAAELESYTIGMRTQPFPDQLPDPTVAGVCDEAKSPMLTQPGFNFSSITACVKQDDGTYEPVEMSPSLMTTFVRQFEDGSTEISSADVLHLSPHWLRLLDEDGAHRVVITTDGRLVWNRASVVAAAWEPSIDVKRWLKEAGIAP